MKTKSIKYLVILIINMMLITTIVSAQDSSKVNSHNTHKMEMKHDKMNMGMNDNKAMMDSCKMKDKMKMTDKHKEMMMKMGNGVMPDSCKQMMKDHKGMVINTDSKMHFDKGVKMDSTHMMHLDAMMKSDNKMKMDSDKSHQPSIVREGAIDIFTIDGNKDGIVYQCQMDFNVISDKPGTDPECGMKLKEVTLETAKENLIKHNFKIKDTVEQK